MYRSSAHLRFLLPSLLLLASCESSCKKTQPYVPYKIDPSAAPSATALPVPSATGSTETPTPPDPRFAQIKARVINPPSATVPVAGGSLTGPSGMLIELVLEADLDADGTVEATAWAKSAGGTTGQLVRGAPGAKLQMLTTLPAEFQGEQGCSLEKELSQIGPHTARLSVRKTCTAEGQPARSKRWWSVVVPVRTPAERLQVTALEQRGAEKVEVQIDGLDRDGDQFDDVALTLGIAGAEASFEEEAGPSMAVELRYFDRPAGLSRDPHEPAASFRAIADRLAKQAKNKKSRGGVAAGARRFRQLHRSLCAEAGALSITIAGEPVQCGAGEAIDRVDRADLEAAIQSGDTLRALGLIDRLEQGRSGKAGGSFDDLKNLIAQSAEIVEAEAYQLPFAPEAPARQVAWGGLSFDGADALLLRTSSSVLRFDAKARVALPEDPIAKSPWPLEVTSPNGASRFDGVYDPCDGGPLRAELHTASGALDVALPIDGTAAGVCARGRVSSAIAVRVGAWGRTGLELIANGIPVGLTGELKMVRPGRIAAQPGSQGSARSADGSQIVAASSLGVAVVSDLAKAQLWRVRGEPNAHRQLHDCVIARSSAAIACVDGAKTRVLLNPRAK